MKSLKKNGLLIGLCAALLLAGCSSTDSPAKPADEQKQETRKYEPSKPKKYEPSKSKDGSSKDQTKTSEQTETKTTDSNSLQTEPVPENPANTESAQSTEKQTSDPEPEESSSQEWKTAYLSFIQNTIAEKGVAGDEDSSRFALIYVDGDEIPELYCNWGFTFAGSDLASYKTGHFATQNLGAGVLSYVPSSGIFVSSGGRMGTYFDQVYQLDQSIALLCEGYYVNNNPQDPEDFEYSWERTPVSQEVYQQNLEQYLPSAARVDTAAMDLLSYSDMIQALSN